VATARNLYLDFGLMAINNEHLKLGVRNLMWKQITDVYLYLYGLCMKILRVKITNVATVQIFEITEAKFTNVRKIIRGRRAIL
jgi:hypothetical protein